MARPFEIEVVSDERVGQGGFLAIRRLRLRNRHPDGTLSREYICDFVERPKGVDAVVLVLYRRHAGAVEVLLRDGLRPALVLGRDPARVPIADARDYFMFTEVVAGIIEEGEVGEAAVRARAVDEAFEEAGARIDPADVELLGSAFPSPGMTSERFLFAAARMPPAEEGQALATAQGDGSPMEEGATSRWVELGRAIHLCTSGEIEDAKTEIVLRRLDDKLRRG